MIFTSQLTNNSESENNKIIKSNNRINNEDICLRYENITKTIIVCDGTVDIPTINDFINNNSDILEMKGEKEWILKSNILILEKGTLNISGLNTRLLKIDSDSPNNLAYSIISRGNLIIDNTNITSWNSTSNEVPELNLLKFLELIYGHFGTRQEKLILQIRFLKILVIKVI